MIVLFEHIASFSCYGNCDVRKGSTVWLDQLICTKQHWAIGLHLLFIYWQQTFNNKSLNSKDHVALQTGHQFLQYVTFSKTFNVSEHTINIIMNEQNSGQFDNLRQKVASKEKLTSLSFSVIVHVFERNSVPCHVGCGLRISRYIPKKSFFVSPSYK